MTYRHLAVWTVSFVLTASGLALSRSGSFMGPRTDAPGEGICTNCHSGTVNSGSGSVGITAPAMYQPQDTIDLSINLAHTGQVRWGFEITVLDASDLPIGTLIVSDPVHTQMTTVSATGRQYVFHTSTGTYNGTPDASPGWTLKWVAPASGAGDATFWIAGLAANGSGTSGDFCYTDSLRVTENTTVEVVDTDTRPLLFRLRPNYPNPFNPTTRVSFELREAAHVHLEVFDALGRRTAVLIDAPMEAGSHTALWDADLAGSGVYFYRLQAGSESATGRMLLLK